MLVVMVEEFWTIDDIISDDFIISYDVINGLELSKQHYLLL